MIFVGYQRIGFKANRRSGMCTFGNTCFVEVISYCTVSAVRKCRNASEITERRIYSGNCGDFSGKMWKRRQYTNRVSLQESDSCELPSLSEFLLTASELLVLRLSARLVVVSWSHSRDGWATADGVVGLSRALLAAGAQCVLVSLWPVPDTAAKILLKAFYSALLQVRGATYFQWCERTGLLRFVVCL